MQSVQRSRGRILTQLLSLSRVCCNLLQIAPSKDNFWSSFRDLKQYQGSQDSGRNGKDAQLHALAALLSTGPVGLGDTCIGKRRNIDRLPFSYPSQTLLYITHCSSQDRLGTSINQKDETRLR